jgi:hypothetical protein
MEQCTFSLTLSPVCPHANAPCAHPGRAWGLMTKLLELLSRTILHVAIKVELLWSLVESLDQGWLNKVVPLNQLQKTNRILGHKRHTTSDAAWGCVKTNASETRGSAHTQFSQGVCVGGGRTSLVNCHEKSPRTRTTPFLRNTCIRTRL